MKDTFTSDIELGIDNLYKKGAFFTVGDQNKANTMTISWGSVGFMWKKPIFMAMIRTSRYSSEFLDLGETFTISIPYNDDMKSALGICGSVSGRDVDKERKANIKFIPSKKIKTPVIQNCDKYYECKIVLKQEINLENLNKDDRDNFYKEGETNHVLYFGEIVEQY